jgi:chemotaxis protein methyltransferase WspC
MGLAAVENLLKESMGLNAASIGSAAIARAVQGRLSACKVGDLHGYQELLRVSVTELQALIEAVVVPETWFFRDRHAFSALTRLVHDEWLPAHPDGVLSLLSLPCSTGEEPYSMAMALFDARVPGNRFRVDAVDISARNLALGMRAVYGRNSFRGDDLGFRDRHFDATSEGHRLRENVRRQVRFEQGNLFAADLLPGVAIYDVIFCRNVLIYFDRPTQDRALVVLNRLLHAKGTLFVAPAETALPVSHDLVSTNEPLAFAFRKASVLPSAAKKKAALPVTAPAPRGPVMQALPTFNRGERKERREPDLFLKEFPASSASSAVKRGAFPAGPLPARSADSAAHLNEASRLADQGHFVEAATRCEEHLRLSGPSATAFYLLGLVRDATGNHSEAASYYRKALYLDPNHYDTQIHLALLMETQGDPAGAQVLRNRARRLEQKSKASHE